MSCYEIAFYIAVAIAGWFFGGWVYDTTHPRPEPTRDHRDEKGFRK